MSSNYRVLKKNDLEKASVHEHTFSGDVLVGLSKKPKRISSKYFYDQKGTKLFQKIMDLPEYYLTKCEFNILKTKRQELSRLVKKEPFNLVELGAGDGRKTRLLLKDFLNRKLTFKYIPIDISESAMKILTHELNQKMPELKTEGIVAEYFEGLRWLSNLSFHKNMVLFLGSNLGNFNKTQSRVFLHNLWNSLQDGDYAVIGFDLKKDIDIMLRAYNDSQGVTSAFNLNLLRRINRELRGNFNLKKFRHYSNYDVFTGAMESYLVSLEKQEVFLKKIGQSFSFQAWEPIHTEYSYKYLCSDIKNLAQETGFEIEKQLYDSKRYFVDSIWKVKKATAPEGTSK
ncbi:MAG: L-histidine N(alpha)-methyltransferase [Candidatus Aminicenantes bacterium]|nr:L-histidine N(alpha)-methyltransferase [Candidatus Aminicenantes bacterium]